MEGRRNGDVRYPKAVICSMGYCPRWGEYPYDIDVVGGGRTKADAREM